LSSFFSPINNLGGALAATKNPGTNAVRKSQNSLFLDRLRQKAAAKVAEGTPSVQKNRSLRSFSS
jgi:hypothetical protein